jgi:hypothetical protein
LLTGPGLVFLEIEEHDDDPVLRADLVFAQVVLRDGNVDFADEVAFQAVNPMFGLAEPPRSAIPLCGGRAGDCEVQLVLDGLEKDLVLRRVRRLVCGQRENLA